MQADTEYTSIFPPNNILFWENIPITDNTMINDISATMCICLLVIWQCTILMASGKLVEVRIYCSFPLFSDCKWKQSHIRKYKILIGKNVKVNEPGIRATLTLKNESLGPCENWFAYYAQVWVLSEANVGEKIPILPMEPCFILLESGH